MSNERKYNLFCTLIEHAGRRTKNHRGDAVAAMDDACLNRKAGRSLK